MQRQWRARRVKKKSKPDQRSAESRRQGQSRRAQAPPRRGARPTRRPLPAEPPQWTPAEVEEAFRRFAAANPDPRSELQYINPFTLLVAVVLSAQATDAGVNKATPALFALADTPEKMVALGEARVRDLIKTIGLYPHQGEERDRAVAAAHRPARRQGARTTARRSKRCPASGARPPTSCSMSLSASRPSRSTPTFSASATAPAWRVGKTPLDVEMKLMAVVPEKYLLHAHHWLILHGRYTCLARRPLCETCIIADLCKWPGKTVNVAPAAARALEGCACRASFEARFARASG